MDSIADSDALISLVCGIILALVGNILRKEYRRLFIDPRRDMRARNFENPFAAYLGYIASFLFTASLLFFASAGYSILNQLWRHFNQ